MQERVARIVESDVISSSTPLEMAMAGVHPRLHTNRQHIDFIKEHLNEEPYSYIIKSMKRNAENIQKLEVLAESDNGQPIKTKDFQRSSADKRCYGDWIISTAGYYLLTREPFALESALKTMRALAEYQSWGHSLIFGHYAQGMACGLDWLWDEIEVNERNYFLDILYKHSKHVFDEWASYKSGEPFGYSWNIMGVILAGLSSAAMVLYGERPDIAPLINMAVEKSRMSSFALNDDGVSPEGIMYGHYYVSLMTASFVLIRDLIGVDLFRTCQWYRNFSDAVKVHTLPRKSWVTDARFFQFGDAHSDLVGGYCNPIWACAEAYHDPHAQYFANDLATVVHGKEAGNIFSALWYDYNLKPEPYKLPAFKHFNDLDIAIGRDCWSGDESAYAVKCGAAAGKKGITYYPNPLAGGHMQPNSGVLQIFSHDEWILPHPGYTWKRTAYHNCMLVNGIGQRGEESEWFEDLSYRQGAQSPTILHSESSNDMDYILANVGPAYQECSGVKQYYRHVLYVKPDCWVVIDAVEFNSPAIPEILWHTVFELTEEGAGIFRGNGEKAKCRISVLNNENLAFKTEQQTILHSSKYEISPLQLLRISPTSAVVKQVVISVIETAAKDSDFNSSVTCDQSNDSLTIAVNGKAIKEFYPWK